MCVICGRIKRMDFGILSGGFKVLPGCVGVRRRPTHPSMEDDSIYAIIF